MSFFGATCSVKNYIFVVAVKLYFQRIFFQFSVFSNFNFVLLCMFDWWLYLFGYSHIFLGTTLYIGKDEEKERWMKSRS